MSVDIFGRPSGGSGLMGPPGPPGPRGPKGHDGALIDPTSSYETYVNFINLRKKNWTFNTWNCKDKRKSDSIYWVY